jgi:putative ABC transport system permease protein
MSAIGALSSRRAAYSRAATGLLRAHWKPVKLERINITRARSPHEALAGLIALPIVIWRRLLSRADLLAAVWAGLTLTVAIVVSIPVYAETTGYRILIGALAQENTNDLLPPFSMIYKYGGARDPAITWEHFRSVDQLAGNLRGAGINLPAPPSVRYAATEKLRLGFPDGQGKEVMFSRIGFQSDIEQHIRIVQGDLPAPYNGSGPVDVLVSETTANNNTILVDDIYLLQATNARTPINLTVRIAGIWRPLNPNELYWFNPPSALSDVLIVPEATLAQVLNVPDTPLVTFGAWYTAIDGSSVRSSDVAQLTTQIEEVTANVAQSLPGVRLDRSPLAALERHREQVRVLTVTLALFSVPLLGLIGYFTFQIAGMVVQRQQAEVAVLRSRGSTRSQVLWLALGEGSIVGVAALIVGVPLGLLIAQLMTWTQSFLSFAVLPGPAPALLGASWWHGALTVALVLPAIMLPAFASARRTIIAYKQERARSTSRPLWQRMYLDIFLLIPALYGYQQLRLNGSIGIPGVTNSTDDPFRNPLLLLAPALLAFAIALVALRFLPGVLRLLAWGFAKLPGVSIVTALRFLARSPSAYSDPVLLIALTLSLAIFTASMARTLDSHSADRASYRAGADVRMVAVTAGQTSATIAGDAEPEILRLDTLDAGEAGFSSTGEVVTQANSDYLFVPVDDFLDVEGVEAVTRVAPSQVDLLIGTGDRSSAIFYGVDRLTLPATIERSWRADYAPESLGALMNRIGESQDSALVSATFAEENGLRVGDRFRLVMSDLGPRQEVTFVMAGTLAYFPTLYDEGEPFVIGNLDYSFDAQGAQYPYEVWLRLAPDAEAQPIRVAALRYGLRILNATPDALLRLDLLRPERQGLFGLLSVGFLATTVVTVIGFLAYTLLSFQRRLVELGVLRAIGLSTRQLGVLLASEQALVIGFGALLGTAIGVLVSELFVPFLQVRLGTYPLTPPFLVRIPWEQIGLVYAVAGGLLACTVAAILILLRRMRIFEAVKLGEAV